MPCIHGMNLGTVAYTPGRFARAHPNPQDTTPTSTALGLPLIIQAVVRGPPESPWHESLPGAPFFWPAHIMLLASMRPRYWLGRPACNWQAFWLMYSTVTCCAVRGDAPPEPM